MTNNTPFALSLSKGSPSLTPTQKEEGQGFDKLSPNGDVGQLGAKQ